MLLETKKLCKRFGNMYALHNIDFHLAENEIHGLVGENGAGKSTLIKILSGVYTLDSGEIYWQGQKTEIAHPLQSRMMGINVIHQDRNLIPSFTGVENVYLGLEYEAKYGFIVDWAKMRAKVYRVMEDLGIAIPLDLPASSLSPPQRTMLEIIRALMTRCKLLILDEPTAALTDKEAEALFNIIGKLKSRGTSILYVTHRIDEIFRLTDRVTVLRNGELVKTVDTASTDKKQVIQMMTDNWKRDEIEKSNRRPGRIVLAVNNITSLDKKVNKASFIVHAGEILGIFGLSGSGRTELLECIYGLRQTLSGTVTLDGKELKNRNPINSIQSGLVLICEDRRSMALIDRFSVKDNIILSTFSRYAKMGILNRKRELANAAEKIAALQIKVQSPFQPVSQLSGGNQQKVVFAKSLMSKPKVFLCDEPTQAVDVKTRSEIHRLLRSKAAEGSAVVFVSSDLKEMLEVADRVQVMAGGTTKECFINENLTSEQVLACCYAV